MVKNQLALEWSAKERFLSPLLFSLTVLLLFNFSFGHIEKEQIQKMLVAESFLSILLASQMITYRVWDFELEDNFFEQLKRYRHVSFYLFFSKLLVALTNCGFILFSTMIFSCLFHGQEFSVLLSVQSFGFGLISFVNIQAVGILLAAITSQARNKHILFPLLYFPLISPILIIGTQAMFHTIQLQNQGLGVNETDWDIFLLGISLVYLTSTALLFSEYFEK